MKRRQLGEEKETKVQDWKTWRAEREAQRKKWKEEKLLKKLEKEEKKEKEEVQHEEDGEGKRCGRPYTISIAVPGSIMDNAQNAELRTYLAGQVARAAAVFCVDEVVIYDDTGAAKKDISADSVLTSTTAGRGTVQMARILQYLECPQYLRKQLFPIHRDLQFAGLLNPLDCSHHLRATEDAPYREGIVTNLPVKEGKGSLVNCGLKKEVRIDRHLQPGIRVTVKLNPKSLEDSTRKLSGVAVAPSTPREEHGIYWGYEVRVAHSLSTVLTECPFPKGYDLTLGTSDKGDSVDDLELPRGFKHAIVVFGGLQGLEAALEADEDLNIDDPSFLFSHYINTCPGQGSRTIRTEEAILITLAALRPKVAMAQNLSSEGP
uniref:28S rRNA (uridine-N(3))-methyltransferase n=1 Tax=Ornithodoros turicata TaxID=34597 RepID=A0A2R5LJC5_9ACAR